MPLITGIVHVLAGVLVVAGIAKLVTPSAAAALLGATGLPSSPWLVRILASVEIAVGAAVFSFGGRFAASALGLTYAGFAAFVGIVMVRDIRVTGCGCFGEVSDEPPGWFHLSIDVVAVGIAAIAVLTPIPDLPAVLADQPVWSLPYLAFAAIGIWLIQVMLTDMPRLMHAVREAGT